MFVAPKVTADPVDTLIDEFKRLASRRDVGAGLQRIVGRLPVLLGIDRAVVYRFNAADKRLVITHETSGATPSLLGSIHPLAQLPAFLVNSLETGMQVAIEDYDRYPIAPSQRRALRFSNVKSSLIVPFSSERKPAGLLVVDVYNSARTWDAKVQTALQKIARVIGAGISGTKRGLHISEGDATLEIRGAQLNMLSNLAKTLADHRGADAIIDSVSMQLAGVYGAGSARVSIRSSHDRTIAESLETGETLVRDNGEGSRVVVPMIVNGDGVGALDISLAAPTLSADDAQFLEAVANMVASAVTTAERYERVRYEAITDGLTGIYNHRFAMEQYNALFAQARSSKNPLSLLMIDIDKIRDINNAYGHLVGDSVLRYVASELKASVESHEVAARYGGEEFIMVLPSTGVEEATSRARRLIERIAENTTDGVPACTISIGIAETPMHGTQADRLLEIADKALYVAKYGGRNRLHVANRNINSEWERLAQEAFFAVLTSKQFSTGPHAIEKAAERVAGSGGRNIDMALALAQAVDVRDKYTSGHSHAVANYALKLGKLLAYGDAELEELRLGALLHDVGKIGTPESILAKDGPLTDAEFDIMRKHPGDGARILSPIPQMRRVSALVETHQESWDGTGYPLKLKGEAIPRLTRIISIADAYHAMVSTRPYRKGMTIDKACGILTNGAGKQWDPRFVQGFVQMVST